MVPWEENQNSKWKHSMGNEENHINSWRDCWKNVKLGYNWRREVSWIGKHHELLSCFNSTAQWPSKGWKPENCGEVFKMNCPLTWKVFGWCQWIQSEWIWIDRKLQTWITRDLRGSRSNDKLTNLASLFAENSLHFSSRTATLFWLNNDKIQNTK